VLKPRRPKPNPWDPSRDVQSPSGRTEYAQDCTAFQLLAQGECPEHLQKRAIECLMHICGTYDLEFRPGGAEGRRASDFAAGKRSVGLEVVAMLRVNVSKLLESTTGEPQEQP
jgi:hypothetical protein